MSVHGYRSTSTGRAYRWWGVGAVVFLVLAGIGGLGGLPLIVLGVFSSGGPAWLQGVGMAAVFALIPAGILGAVVCGHLRYRASFTNALVSEGAITAVTEMRNSDDNSYYYRLIVSVEVDGGPTIRRHCTMGGKNPRPEIGWTLRFRHTTLDPENLQDALFDGVREHR